MFKYAHSVVAHRGGGAFAPENTLAAVRKGQSMGYRAVEFDVMLCADGLPVLMHDERLGRTVAGGSDTFISSLASEEVLSMDAGAFYSTHANAMTTEDFSGEPVPSYESVVRYCVANGIWMNVELKPCPGFGRETGQVVAALTAALFENPLKSAAPDYRELPLFSSFCYESLMAAKEACPGIPRALLLEKAVPDWKEMLQRLGAVALHINYKELTESLAREVKDSGYGLSCYTVNAVDVAEGLSAMGVDSFCTDRLDLFQNYRVARE